jgi:hypothetical protein
LLPKSSTGLGANCRIDWIEPGWCCPKSKRKKLGSKNENLRRLEILERQKKKASGNRNKTGVSQSWQVKLEAQSQNRDLGKKNEQRGDQCWRRVNRLQNWKLAQTKTDLVGMAPGAETGSLKNTNRTYKMQNKTFN